MENLRQERDRLRREREKLAEDMASVPTMDSEKAEELKLMREARARQLQQEQSALNDRCPLLPHLSCPTSPFSGRQLPVYTSEIALLRMNLPNSDLHLPIFTPYPLCQGRPPATVTSYTSGGFAAK